MNKRVVGLMKDVKRSILEVKITANNNSRNLRQMLFLVTKIVKQQPIDPNELCHEETLPQYIPCQTIRDLQDLDRKLNRDGGFFAHSVRKQFCIFAVVFLYRKLLALVLRSIVM